ncbi:MAG: hypothetical protein IAI49_01085 [Candidatus Eremiobacteraeota bacterium]|nr:hypothetical protein [Candidatus Eremiobacteraeota bacterium]
MQQTDEISYRVPFTSDSSLAAGFHVSAALGGGPPHAFMVDTGSVGILVPRPILGPDYQNFDPSLDIEFKYVSSGNTYRGQWVEVQVVLGVPANWDGTGDYPIARLEVFAFDEPAVTDRGIFGIGFGIGGSADGGPARNPLLALTYQGTSLSRGYIVTQHGIDAGLSRANTQGFAFVALERHARGHDWLQPVGNIRLSSDSTDGFTTDLKILIDTGIDEMILWVSADDAPSVPRDTAFPAGISVSVAAPPADRSSVSALQYSFVTGDSSQPMAPSQVLWRVGTGINTGRNVLAGTDYLYDAAQGRIGFRDPPG